MTRISMVFAGWVIAWPGLVCSQTWSAEQREIVAQVARCNDGWTASIEHKKFELYETACPETEGAVFWYTNAEQPVTYGGATGLWRSSSAANRAAKWSDLRPLVVQIDGDVAFIYYNVVWTVEPNGGQATSFPTRRFTVFRRHNRQWLMAGGSVSAGGTPPPPAR